MAASPRELEELRRKGLEAEGKKFAEYGLPPSLALRYGSLDKYNEERRSKGRQPAKPSLKDFMDKAGVDASTASDLMYGVIGSNIDDRNFDAIMSSSDPLAAAREATRQYYERGAIRPPEKSPQEKMAAIQSDARQAQERRQQVLDMILSGQAADKPTAYGFTQEQIDAARAAQASGQGLGSFIQQQRSAAFAPAQRDEFNRRVNEISNPTTVQFNRRIPGTPIAVSGDPDSGKQRSFIVDASGMPLRGAGLGDLANFGYDPYTLQPMYTTQQDAETGQISYTPAFDTASLGYDFGDLDPYSREGLKSYFGQPLPGTFVGDPYDTGRDPYAEIMGRMGYEYEPYDYSYTVR